MNNSRMPSSEVSDREDNAQQKKNNNLLEFWFRLTAVPEPPETATFKEKELARRMRSLSYAVGTIWLIFILFIPGCFVLPNHYVLYADFGMMPICLIALFINKNFRQPVVAGALVTVCFELALAAVCLTTWPFDEPSLQQYELFVLGEIVALTLMSPRAMMLVGFCNAVFITLDLLFQPHTAILDHDLHIQFAAILIRPVSLQLMVAVVVGLYSLGSIRTTRRADKAQMTASLEHHKAAQERQRNEEMQQLNTHIAHITEQYATMMNRRAITKIEITDIPSVLIPITQSYNMLFARLSSANRAEGELQTLKQAIRQCTEQFSTYGQQEQIVQTGTELDPLLAAMRYQQQTKIQPHQRYQPEDFPTSQHPVFPVDFPNGAPER